MGRLISCIDLGQDRRGPDIVTRSAWLLPVAVTEALISAQSETPATGLEEALTQINASSRAKRQISTRHKGECALVAHAL